MILYSKRACPSSFLGDSLNIHLDICHLISEWTIPSILEYGFISTDDIGTVPSGFIIVISKMASIMLPVTPAFKKSDSTYLFSRNIIYASLSKEW